MSEKFCLKWNDFQTNVSNTFRKLRTSDHFYDVTLVSDDQQQVSAHKVVLASSSEYFKNILTSNKHSHPMLCLNGVSSAEMKNILDFIYNGEIQLYQDHLDQFLAIAQRFQLEGLIQGADENNPEPQHFEEYEHKIIPENHNMALDTIENVNGTGGISMKNQLVKTQKIIAMDSANFENLEELDQKISDMIEKVEGTQKRRCIPCGQVSRHIGHAKEHAETHIEGLSFPCQYCSKTFRSRHAFKVHISSRCLHK